jgi:hypothetical protein
MFTGRPMLWLGRMVLVLVALAFASVAWNEQCRIKRVRSAMRDVVAFGGVLNEGEYGSENFRLEMNYDEQDPAQQPFGFWSSPIQRIDIVWNVEESRVVDLPRSKFAKALCEFKQLRTLYLEGDRVEELVAELPRLANVRTLSLEQTQLDDANLDGLLAAMPGLESCKIDETEYLKSLSAVNRLSNLRRLMLTSNNRSPILNTLGGDLLTRLEDLTLWNFQIPSEFLSKCRSLRALDVSDSVLSSHSNGSPQAALDKLHDLTCEGRDEESVSGFLTAIDAPNLSQLRINSHRMTDNDIDLISQQSKLAHLHLYAIDMTAEQFARLANVPTLRRVTLKAMDYAFCKRLVADFSSERLTIEILPVITL